MKCYNATTLTNCPTFSIIIPTYNVAPWIADCLDSVIHQDFGDWECICVDDGSTDGTRAILDDAAQQDARFHIIKLTHGGVSSARDAGLAAVRGKWIVFLDSDDLVSTHLLTACSVAATAVPDADILAYDVEVFHETPPDFPYRPALETIRPRDISRSLTLASLGFYFYGRAYRRELLKNIQFKDLAPSEDYVFLAEATCRAQVQAVIPAALYGYRMRAGSQVNSAMTSTRVVHLLGAVLEICATLETSGRRVDPPLARSLANDAAERFAREYAQLPSNKRKEVRIVLKDAYRRLARVPFFSLFQRIRFSILASVPWRGIFFLLCRIPQRIKLCGLHRRAPRD